MSWLLLILGLILWADAHLFKRLMPDARARLDQRLGSGAKGVVALALLVAVVLMAIGYRGTPDIPVYTPLPGMGYLNNLLMLLAFLLIGAGSVGSWLSTRMRHPMLIGFKTWAVAHLLVNGDLASIVLFGGLLAWAVIQVIVINRSEPAWTRGTAPPTRRDAVLVGVWLAVFALAAGIHTWLGYNPFLGTYG